MVSLWGTFSDTTIKHFAAKSKRESRGREMLLAMTRPVPPSITECELTHLERQPIDWTRATEQHHDYERALQALGCTLERLPVAPTQPDSVFIEDAAFVVDECAVIARPGAASRRAETSAVSDALRPYRRLAPIEAPGTLDGGDVLRIGRRVYVGLSSRTNAEGIRQLSVILEPLGYSVESVVVRECLHLKTAVSALGDEELLLNPRMVDGTSFGGASWIEIDPSEPSAANVICLEKTVLCSADAPRTRRRLEARGYDVVPVDASELAKAEAGLTCCSLLLRV
jgi:dimethylargininase